MIRVLLVDDQALVRAGFRMVLDAEPDIEVVGEAADGLQAVEEARRLRPDVVLMDVRMPRLDGLEATRRLAGPDVADPACVLILTTYDSMSTSSTPCGPAPAGSCSSTPPRRGWSRRSGRSPRARADRPVGDPPPDRRVRPRPDHARPPGRPGPPD